jgi:hypothetical protein
VSPVGSQKIVVGRWPVASVVGLDPHTSCSGRQPRLR